MDANVWLWIALVAFLVFCCVPMLFMRRGHSKDPDHKNAADETQNKLS